MSHASVKQAYKLFPRYPGLRPRDEVIWDSFIISNPSAFDYVYYNVHLGDPSHDEYEREQMQRNGSYEVSQWCVDVLAFASERAYVIEVKPQAGASALGQSLSYTKILIAEGRIPENSQPMVITDSISPITEHAAKLLGIIVATP